MFTEDLSTFFGATEFATPAFLDGAPVVGIFDSAYLTDGAGMLGMGGTQPTYLLPSAQVSADPVGLELVISGKSYFVAQHEPDGTGISRLYLQGNA